MKVTETDSDSLRFLWADQPLQQKIPDTYQMTVHIFGATDSPCCANHALKSAGRDNMKIFKPATVESVLKSFYVDDFLKSVTDTEQAIK